MLASSAILCLLLYMHQSTQCHSIQALNHTGSLMPEQVSINATSSVSLTCFAICGSIKWHINGQVISRDSFQDNHYRVSQISLHCSTSIDPVGCPQCGCSNCNSVKWPTTQTYTSTLSVAVNESMIVDCVSIQSYQHQQFVILRKRFNINAIKRIHHHPIPIASTTISTVLWSSIVTQDVLSSISISPTGTPSTCTCDQQSQSDRPQRGRSSQQEQQYHSQSACSQEITTTVLASTVVFAAIIVIALVMFIIIRRWHKKA